jgi:hypothetical protein
LESTAHRKEKKKGSIARATHTRSSILSKNGLEFFCHCSVFGDVFLNEWKEGW